MIKPIAEKSNISFSKNHNSNNNNNNISNGNNNNNNIPNFSHLQGNN